MRTSAMIILIFNIIWTCGNNTCA